MLVERRSCPRSRRAASETAGIRAGTIRVRGRGLMLAVELRPDDPARRYCEALRARAFWPRIPHEHTIRIAPPLVTTSDQVDLGAGAVRCHLDGISRGSSGDALPIPQFTRGIQSAMVGAAQARLCPPCD